MKVSALDSAIQKAGPGGSVLMLADKGNYNISGSISIQHGGTDAAPVKIMGVNSAGQPMDIQIYGTRNPTYTKGMAAVGNEVFKLVNGANNLTFEGMDFHNVGAGFRLGANMRNITIEDMEATNVRSFVNNYVLGTNTSATVTGLTVRDVHVTGFSKSVIKFQYNTNDVLIENVYGDCKNQGGDGGAFPAGIFMLGTAHNVVIKDTTMLNCISPGSSSSYWQGDGFVSERGTYDLRFENTVARGSGDGGYDLKSHGNVLINAVAEDNKINFRLWGTTELIDCTGIDPHKRGGIGAQSQVQVNSGGDVKVTRGDFVDSGSATKVVVDDSSGVIGFSGTHFVHAAGTLLKAGAGRDTIRGIDMSLVKEVAATGSYSSNGEIYLGSTTLASTSMVALSGDEVLASASADTLASDGADQFDYGTLSGAPAGTSPDRVLDFAARLDHLDLSGLAERAGQVRFDDRAPAATKIIADIGGDGVADFTNALLANLHLNSGDFML
jgi:hypothetical protein